LVNEDNMMKTQFMIATALWLTLSCSAGDNEEACSVTRDLDYLDVYDPVLPICIKARFISARASQSLLVSQANLNRHYQRLALIVEAEPILAGMRSGGIFFLPLMTSDDPDINRVWSSGKLTPITPDVDNALCSIEAEPQKLAEPRRPTDRYVSFETERVYSGQILSNLLQPAGISLAFVAAESRPLDTILTWPAGVSSEGDDVSTVQIDTAIAGSDGSLDFAAHYFRAIVTPTSATVYDMGGEPLPAGTLAPTTLPWPEPQ
jgi:hypothetical protein